MTLRLTPELRAATEFSMTNRVFGDRVLALPRAQATGTPGDAERDVRGYLKKRLKHAGGELRKCSWFPRANAPDELVLLPSRARGFFAELKRPGEWPNDGQLREIATMQAAGLEVYLIDSREAVDAALFW